MAKLKASKLYSNQENAKNINPTYVNSLKKALNQNLEKTLSLLKYSSTPKDIISTLEKMHRELDDLDLLDINNVMLLETNFSRIKSRFASALYNKVLSNDPGDMQFKFLQKLLREDYKEKAFNGLKDPSLKAHKFKQNMQLEIEQLKAANKEPSAMKNGSLMQSFQNPQELISQLPSLKEVCEDLQIKLNKHEDVA